MFHEDGQSSDSSFEDDQAESKLLVFVTGSSGKVGKAVVKYLSKHHSAKFNIRAGTRDPEKCKDLEKLPGVSVVEAEMGNEALLVQAFDTVDYLFLITPTTEKRVLITLRTLDAAKTAKIKHIIFLSAFCAEINDLIIGGQFKPLEAKIMCMDVPYTILRIMMFLDNLYQCKDLLESESVVAFPLDAERPYTPVAVRDVCRAVGSILRNREPHADQIYHLASDRFSLGDLAKEFGAALKKRVTYRQIAYEEVFSQYLELGFAEWQRDALVEFYRGIDSGEEWANRPDISDFTTITGEKPTSMKTWAQEIASEIRAKNFKNLYGQHGTYRTTGKPRPYRPYKGYKGSKR